MEARLTKSKACPKACVSLEAVGFFSEGPISVGPTVGCTILRQRHHKGHCQNQQAGDTGVLVPERTTWLASLLRARG